jgi:hypothetical protein
MPYVSPNYLNVQVIKKVKLFPSTQHDIGWLEAVKGRDERAKNARP